MIRTLQRLLAPKSLTVIGGKEAERVVDQCVKLGFEGAIWPVHTTRDVMRGHKCFRSVADLPEAPDAAYIAVNRERTIDIVAELSNRGCGGAVCYAAGFAEADAEDDSAADLQARLLNAACDMPIIGPNCYGFLNAMDSAALWPDQHGMKRVGSGVAILTQSSNLAISLTMQRRGLPLAFTGTLGNQAQTGISEMAMGLLEDTRITALGLHIEGLDSVSAFERLAMRARELRKPIVVMKAGKSQQAQAATLTHTASLAGSDRAHTALFRRLGVARVETIDQFLETLKLLHCGGALEGNRLVSLSCSGGEAALMADAGEARDVAFPEFDVETTAALKTELGSIVTIANPLDYNTFIWGDWPAMQRVYTAALSQQNDLAMLVLDFPREDVCDVSDWDHALDSWLAAVKQTGARAAVVATMVENMPECVAERLIGEEVAPLCSLENAVAAAEGAVAIGKVWQAPAPPPLLPPQNRCHPRANGDPSPAGDGDRWSGKMDSRRSGNDNKGLVVLDEHQSKQELAAFGLVIPKSAIIRNTVDIPSDLKPPFALKALGISHKTEAGGVYLNLHDDSGVANALQAMSGLSDIVLLEEMAPKPDAELIVGISRDPVVGLIMTIGAGGVMVELLNDTATLLLPARETDIRTALASLKINRILVGWRGSEATDIDALITNVICIANYACANADTLEELDVNPLFASQYGSVAVDALIVKRKSQ